MSLEQVSTLTKVKSNDRIQLGTTWSQELILITHYKSKQFHWNLLS